MILVASISEKPIDVVIRVNMVMVLFKTMSIPSSRLTMSMIMKIFGVAIISWTCSSFIK